MPCWCCYCKGCCDPAGLPTVLWIKVDYIVFCVIPPVPATDDDPGSPGSTADYAGTLWYKLPICECNKTGPSIGAYYCTPDGWPDYPLDVCCGVAIRVFGVPGGPGSTIAITCETEGGEAYSPSGGPYSLQAVPVLDACLGWHLSIISTNPYPGGGGPPSACDCDAALGGVIFAGQIQTWQTGVSDTCLCNGTSATVSWNIYCAKPPDGSTIIEPNSPPGILAGRQGKVIKRSPAAPKQERACLYLGDAVGAGKGPKCRRKYRCDKGYGDVTPCLNSTKTLGAGVGCIGCPGYEAEGSEVI